MNKISDRLKIARKELGFSQVEMQEFTGCLQKDISRMENSKTRFIPHSYLEKLWDLGINLNWIYSGQGNMRIVSIDESLNTDSENSTEKQKEEFYHLRAENKVLKEQVKELKQEKQLLMDTFKTLKNNNIFK